LTYIEDPFAEKDIEGYQKLKAALMEAGI